MARKKKEPTPTEPTAPATAVTAPLVAPSLTEPSDAEIATLIADLDAADEPPAGEPSPQQLLATVDQLLEIERSASAGRWVRWERFTDAEVLVCDGLSAIQENHRLDGITRAQLAEAAAKANKSYDRNAPLPLDVQFANQARSRFNRAVKGWRGAAFAGTPWGWESFFRLWTSSIDFRAFVNAKMIELRGVIEKETAELGKASASG